jgi:hypothetical protein
VSKEFNKKYSLKDEKTEFTWKHDFNKFVSSLNPNLTPLQMNEAKYDELRRQFYLILVYNLNLCRDAGINRGLENRLEDLIANNIKEKKLMNDLKRKYNLEKLHEWCVYEIIFLMFAKDSDYEEDSEDSEDSDSETSADKKFNENLAFRLVCVSLQSNLNWAELDKKYSKALDIVFSLSSKNTMIDIKNKLDGLPILILLLMSHYFEN